MTTIAALWLPILLSAVIVFIASSIIHMAPLWHRQRAVGAARPGPAAWTRCGRSSCSPASTCCRAPKNMKD